MVAHTAFLVFTRAVQSHVCPELFMEQNRKRFLIRQRAMEAMQSKQEEAQQGEDTETEKGGKD